MQGPPSEDRSGLLGTQRAKHALDQLASSQVFAAAAPFSRSLWIPQADEVDHCETAPEAYKHVACVLHAIAEHLGRRPGELRIYDPYYCNGAVARHLEALGFSHVYNRNEDFYAVQVRVRRNGAARTPTARGGDGPSMRGACDEPHLDALLSSCCRFMRRRPTRVPSSTSS